MVGETVARHPDGLGRWPSSATRLYELVVAGGFKELLASRRDESRRSHFVDCVSERTVEGWEQRRRHPSGPVLTLLRASKLILIASALLLVLAPLRHVKVAQAGDGLLPVHLRAVAQLDCHDDEPLILDGCDDAVIPDAVPPMAREIPSEWSAANPRVLKKAQLVEVVNYTTLDTGAKPLDGTIKGR